MLAGVALLGSLAYTRLITADRSRRRWTVVVAASIVAVVILVAANLRLDFLNMAEDARTVPGSGGRVFWHVNHEKYQPAEVLFSRSSVAGRSDLIAYTMDWKERRITARQTCENSKIIDTVRRKPVKRYAVDPRLVAPDLIENPDTLIIGTSGEGVLKPVRALGRGKVFGVEINPAVYKMFTREAAELCDYCYDDVSMQIIDARSYLKQTDRHFDYITLMNAHFTKGNRADRVADPEYLQTVEAIKDYFAHLTDEGAILIEERDHNSKVNQRQILRLMYTMFVAMHELGIEHPERHLFLWSWEGTARNSLFIQFLVKKSEITRRDHDVMLSFFDDLALSRKPCGLCRGAKLVYSPFDESGSGNRYADFIGLSMAEKENFQKKKVNISANTDDRPFPWNVNRRTKPLDAFLRHFLLLSLVPFLPIAAVFVLRYRRRQMETVPHLFFFALIGVGYLVVEIALMQKFNHFLGSPTYSLIVILGGMLVCSGVGSFWSREWTTRSILGACGRAGPPGFLSVRTRADSRSRSTLSFADQDRRRLGDRRAAGVRDGHPVSVRTQRGETLVLRRVRGADVRTERHFRVPWNAAVDEEFRRVRILRNVSSWDGAVRGGRSVFPLDRFRVSRRGSRSDRQRTRLKPIAPGPAARLVCVGAT
ncbi:MAG: hypothetical protein M5R36_06330 [Deltaproteobacteria bacterium]|nr:hypothetical protein [Deltaproteobacteria bacterium]